MVFTHDLTNKQQFCMVCILIDHRNDVRMFKKRFGFPAKSMVDKVTDYGKLLSICFLQ